MKIHQTRIRSAQTLCAGRDDSIGNGDRVRMREHGRHQTTVVTISGEVDAANSDRVHEFATRLMLVGNPLILDLSGVKFFAARAILTLIAVDDACRVTAVPWAIVPSRAVNRVLWLTDCHTSLPTASSVPEALHQLTAATLSQSAAAHSHDVERRRPTPPDQLPIEALHEIPALLALGRLPIPALAVDGAGAILFVNSPFCDMVGYAYEELSSMTFDDIFCGLPPDDGRVPRKRAATDRLIALRHKEGHYVWADMSESAMRRCDDSITLNIFHDRTEELWVNSGAMEQPVSRKADQPVRPGALGGGRGYPAPVDRSWPA